MDRRRSRVALLAMAIAAVSLVQTDCDFARGIVRELEEAKLRQKIAPLQLHGVSAQQAISRLMKQAKEPLPLLLCPELAPLPVSIETTTAQPLRQLLQSVADHAGANVTWYAICCGYRLDRCPAYPAIWCPEQRGHHLLKLGTDGNWRPLS